MAGADRMTIEEVVKQVMVREHGDVVRAALEAVCRAADGGRGVRAGRRRARRAPPGGSADASQRLPGAGVADAGRDGRVADPQDAPGQLLPVFLEPRRRSEQALLSVVQQAYVWGSRRGAWTSWSRASGCGSARVRSAAICGALDEHVDAFRTRPLEGPYPYLFLDAKVEKVRDGGRVVNKALVIAHGVHETGRREILSIDVGEAETEAFWTDFLRGLVKRGLVGVQLAISDAHAGLKAAIAKVLGCAWQRCTVHFLRDCLGHARRDQHGLLAALIRPIFNADASRRRATGSQKRSRISTAAWARSPPCSKTPSPTSSPSTRSRAGHWRKLRSTNPLERFNREVGRRTDVVGIFPDDQSLIRLAGMLCIEQNDEWLVGRGYLSAESISLVLAGPDDHIDKEIKEEVPELQAA